MLIYAATVVLSACLLFLVQPLIAKIILPWFGGTSAVWTAALVFFQLTLLCGYGYAHWLMNRVQPRLQWIIHSSLLLAGCALMPILPSEAWRSADAGTGNPTAQILLLLTASVGLPAVLLSSTSPLLQAWYMRRRGHEIPYWLFALSNFGSLLALLTFPLLLEPAFESRALAISWSIAFGMFAVMCIAVAWSSRSDPNPIASTAEQRNEPAPGMLQMALWIFFSACASALLVSVSTQLGTNVAPIPLLWVVPLGLYLLTFILSFGNRNAYRRTFFFPLLVASLGCIAWLYTHSDTHQHIRYVIPLYLASLFIVCMTCHGELVQRSPAAPFLTRFYLLIALGGALGGIFVGVIAPAIFDTYLELPLLLIAIAAVMGVIQWRRRGSTRTLWPVRVAMAAGAMMLVGSLALAEMSVRKETLLVSRNFYGVLGVSEYDVGQRLAKRTLTHGTIAHGHQYLSDEYRDFAGSYYSASSGVGRVIEARKAQGPMRIGVIGLGVGVLASYARADDYLRLYEINPDVLNIAEEHFSFLSQAKARGADVQVLIGDARLTLERQEPQSFDVLVVDAFSSDAIPTHLLTSEAIEVYFRHLKPQGVLAVHISNRYLDLTPVCLRAAEHVNRSAILLRDPKGEMSYSSDWVLITSNYELFEHPAFKGASPRPVQAKDSFRGWTDQYSSLWSVLNLSRNAARLRTPAAVVVTSEHFQFLGKKYDEISDVVATIEARPDLEVSLTINDTLGCVADERISRAGEALEKLEQANLSLIGLVASDSCKR